MRNVYTVSPALDEGVCSYKGCAASVGIGGSGEPVKNGAVIVDEVFPNHMWCGSVDQIPVVDPIMATQIEIIDRLSFFRW